MGGPIVHFAYSLTHSLTISSECKQSHFNCREIIPTHSGKKDEGEEKITIHDKVHGHCFAYVYSYSNEALRNNRSCTYFFRVKPESIDRIPAHEFIVEKMRHSLYNSV